MARSHWHARFTNIQDVNNHPQRSPRGSEQDVERPHAQKACNWVWNPPAHRDGQRITETRTLSWVRRMASGGVLCDSGTSGQAPETRRGRKRWEVGGRFRRAGTYVYRWLTHVAVRQKQTQYCKAVILQLKINRFLKSMWGNLWGKWNCFTYYCGGGYMAVNSLNWMLKCMIFFYLIFKFYLRENIWLALPTKWIFCKEIIYWKVQK